MYEFCSFLYLTVLLPEHPSLMPAIISPLVIPCFLTLTACLQSKAGAILIPFSWVRPRPCAVGRARGRAPSSPIVRPAPAAAAGRRGVAIRRCSGAWHPAARVSCTAREPARALSRCGGATLSRRQRLGSVVAWQRLGSAARRYPCPLLVHRTCDAAAASQEGVPRRAMLHD